MHHPSVNLPMSLQQARILKLPDAAYYVPDFISKEEETRLLNQIENRPKREWTELSKRRLQNHPTKLNNDKLIDAPLPLWLSHPTIPRLLSLGLEDKGTSSVTSEPPTEDTESQRHVFSDSPHQKPNHCLINEYQPGQGIMPHEDGSAYHPIVATVSLGGPIVLDIYEKDSDGMPSKTPRYRILQEARSLLITTEDLYKDFLHGIAFACRDDDLNQGSIANWTMLGREADFEQGFCVRKTRTSLTFRDVNMVSKVSRLIPGLNPGRPR